MNLRSKRKNGHLTLNIHQITGQCNTLRQLPHFCILADFLSGPVSVPHLGHHDTSQKAAAKNETMSESMSGPGVYMQQVLYRAILTVNAVTEFGGTYKLAPRRIL